MPQSLTTLQSTALGPVLTVSGVSPTVAVTTTAYPGSATAANPAGDETLTITGTGFNAGVKVYVGSTICTTTYVSATSLTFVTPANSVGSYVLYVYNTDGTNGASPAGITYSAVPVWVTAAGALSSASQNNAYSTSVSATGDTIVYSLTTGSLPTGLSLNASTGAITGTPTVEATSTFSITATDAQNQGVARSFSIAVTAVILVEYLVVAGGGAGGKTAAGGGGGGGYRTAASFSATPGSTYTATVGGGGTTAATYGANGSNSSFSSITASGGGGGGTISPTPARAGQTGGSGGGGGGYATAGDTTPGTAGAGNAGSYTPVEGYAGGSALQYGGGGGGAGAVGGNGTSGSPGNGGIGLYNSISGSNVAYAGGGGGSGDGTSGGLGGAGGGGHGQSSSGGRTDITGNVNTGGGGGAGGGQSGDGQFGSGGSGIVILRYADTYAAAASTTGSPTITTAGGYRVYKYTGTGNITF